MYNLAVHLLTCSLEWVPDGQGVVCATLLTIWGGVGNAHNVERMDDEGEGQSGGACGKARVERGRCKMESKAKGDRKAYER